MKLDALKTLLTAQRDVDAYIALCEETGVGAKECKAIAEMCGCTDVSVTEEECRATGGAVCRYRVSWS